jgi:hypothetical protein
VSHDVGGASGLGLALYPSDYRACSRELLGGDELFQPPPLADLLVPQEARADGAAGGYPGLVSPWWPRCGGFVGDNAVDVAMLTVSPSHGSFAPTPASGCIARLGITGITRDQFGSPVGACTVKLFRTSTDELVSQVISDANGVYLITTPYHPDAHYLVVYKVGSPDIFGTTVNTIIAG